MLDAVQERLRRFRESARAEEILGPGPVAEADALLRQVTRGEAEADIAALRTVGLLYYERYLLLPDGPDRTGPAGTRPRRRRPRTGVGCRPTDRA